MINGISVARWDMRLKRTNLLKQWISMLNVVSKQTEIRVKVTPIYFAMVLPVFIIVANTICLKIWRCSLLFLLDYNFSQVTVLLCE